MLESHGHSDCNAALQILNDAISNLINADRSSLFLMDCEGKNLYAQAFKVSKEEEELVTLTHLEPTCLGDDLNQLVKSVQYKGQNIA